MSIFDILKFYHQFPKTSTKVSLCLKNKSRLPLIKDFTIWSVRQSLFGTPPFCTTHNSCQLNHSSFLDFLGAVLLKHACESPGSFVKTYVLAQVLGGV